MDWCKLLALLVAVTSIPAEAEVPKKKIRIHLPQTVKHIHHHKKIYITNHPASSQYAPAYMPSAEGTVAVPTSVAMPGISNMMPLSTVNLYSEHKPRLPAITSAASQLLPLYHARGYYGPTQPNLEENEYDVPHDITDSYGPPVYSPPVSLPNNHSNKRVKYVKVNDQPPHRKKLAKKGKPKRVPGRHGSAPAREDEHPVSTFHEQFYSDLHGTGTIRKIKKPPRVEKIIDGDTEHIHTYSEEHIHKLMYDDNLTRNLVPISHLSALPPIARPSQIIPYKGAQPLLTIPTGHFPGIAPIAPLTAPGQFEYAAYNPREVTHDHIYHDHGEIPSGVDINKDPLSVPPKGSYNVQGIRLGSKLHKGKIHPFKKSIKPINADFSYYEGIYSDNREKKPQRHIMSATGFGASDEEPSYRSDHAYKKENIKLRNQLAALYGKSVNDYRTAASSPSSPFSVTSKILHDYKPNNYDTDVSGPGVTSKYKKDDYENFKEKYANNHPYDAYSSSSNLFSSEDKNDAFSFSNKKGKKKSISTQNVSFEGQDHATYVDHLGNEALIDEFLNDNTPTALEDIDQFDQSISDSQSPPSITSKSSSAPHYFSTIEGKSQEEETMITEESKNNYQSVEAPTQLINKYASSMATTTSPVSAALKTQASEVPDTRQGKKTKDSNKGINEEYKDDQPSHNLIKTSETEQLQYQSALRGKLKYGDKI